MTSTPVPRRPGADDVEREVARTADLVLKLGALVERYEQQGGDARRLAVMTTAMSRGGQALQRLAGVDVAGLEPATSRV